jgi:hypothetical protein
MSLPLPVPSTSNRRCDDDPRRRSCDPRRRRSIQSRRIRRRPPASMRSATTPMLADRCPCENHRDSKRRSACSTRTVRRGMRQRLRASASPSFRASRCARSTCSPTSTPRRTAGARRSFPIDAFAIADSTSRYTRQMHAVVEAGCRQSCGFPTPEGGAHRWRRADTRTRSSPSVRMLPRCHSTAAAESNQDEVATKPSPRQWNQEPCDPLCAGRVRLVRITYPRVD